MIEHYLQPLPHGVTLSCRAAGAAGRPVLLFLHGFPEGAFVWDQMLEHFSQGKNGGYRWRLCENSLEIVTHFAMT